MERKLLVKVVLVSAVSVVLTLLVIVGVAYAADIFTVDKDGTVRLVITDAGNVGIGTTVPPYLISAYPDQGSNNALWYGRVTDGTTYDINRLTLNAASNQHPEIYLRADAGSTATSHGILSSKSFYIATIWASANIIFGQGITYTAPGTVNVTNPRMFINGTSGNVGVGTTDPKTKLHVTGLPEYADNAAAIAAGLTAGAFYRTGELLKVVY